MTIQDFMRYWDVRVQSTRMKPSLHLETGHEYSMVVVDITTTRASAPKPNAYLFPMIFAGKEGIITRYDGETWAARILLGMALEASYAAVGFNNWMDFYVHGILGGTDRLPAGLPLGLVFNMAENFDTGFCCLFSNFEPKFSSDALYKLARSTNENGLSYKEGGHA